MPALSVVDHYRTQFDSNWKELAMQKVSRTRNFCTVKTGCTGQAETHNQVGPLEGTEVTGQRYKKVVLQDIDTEQRWVRPQEFQLPTGESYWDMNRLAPTIAPTGQHTLQHAAYFGRQCDRVILAAILGTNYTGATGVTAATLSGNQLIAKDYVASGSAADSDLTVAKLIRAKRRLEENEVWSDDMREAGAGMHVAVNARMEETLLNDANSTTGSRLFSKDYMPPTLDDEGKIRSFLGIQFHRTELVNVNNATDGDSDAICYAPLWVSTFVQFDLWGNWTVTIDRRPDLSNATQILSQFACGATRLQEEAVVQIACVQN